MPVAGRGGVIPLRSQMLLVVVLRAVVAVDMRLEAVMLGVATEVVVVRIWWKLGRGRPLMLN
jgi:hypothetical protein